MGTDEGTIVRALSTKHRRYGHHSVVYAEELQRRGLDAARGYATRTAREAEEIARKEPRVVTPDEARERLLAIRGQVDVEPWPLELAGARRALEAAFVVGMSGAEWRTYTWTIAPTR